MDDDIHGPFPFRGQFFTNGAVERPSEELTTTM
jgi:hypothetical protein